MYAQILFEQAKYQEVIQYFEKLITLQKNQTKKKQYKEKLDFCKNSIKKDTKEKYLKLAVKYHRAKEIKLAIKYYKKYYQLTKKDYIAKEIADLYYFNQMHRKSLSYYKAYLDQNPTDNKVRYRYALTLEKEKMYKISTREFYKLAKIINDPKRYEYIYHYGFSLLKSDKRKKAKDIFTRLIRRLDKSDKLYKYTKNALIVASRVKLKPTKHKDIVLFEGAKKAINPIDAFSTTYAKKSNIKTILPSYQFYDLQAIQENFVFDFEYMSSSDKIDIQDYTIGFNNILFVDEWNIGIKLGNYLAKNHTNDTLEFNANKFAITGTYENLQASLGVNSFNTFLDFNPKLTYAKKINNHNLSLNYSYQNGVFYRYEPIMISEKISTNHFSIKDTIILKDRSQFDLSFEINKYSDKNLQFLPTISIPLYRQEKTSMINTVSLYSKLDFNTEHNTTVYSIEDFEDFNTFEFKSKHKFKNSAYLVFGGGLGYSFEQKESLFSTQILMEYPIKKSFSFFVDCRYIDGAQQYEMKKCNVFASYMW